MQLGMQKTKAAIIELGFNRLKPKIPKPAEYTAVPGEGFSSKLEKKQQDFSGNNKVKPVQNEKKPAISTESAQEEVKKLDLKEEGIELNDDKLSEKKNAEVENSVQSGAELKNTKIEEEADTEEDEAIKAALPLDFSFIYTVLEEKMPISDETQLSSEEHEDIREIKALLGELNAKSLSETEELSAKMLEIAEEYPEFEELLRELRQLTDNEKAEVKPTQNEPITEDGLKSLKELLFKLNAETVEVNRAETEPEEVENEKPAVEFELKDKEETVKAQEVKNTEVKEFETEPVKQQRAASKPQTKVSAEAENSVLNNKNAEFNPFVEERAEIEQTVNSNQVQAKVLSGTKLEVLEQVKTQILRQNVGADDRSEIVIRLKPEELGRVELKIELHNDEVTAKFQVASQMVKEAIESNLSDLKMALKDKGFDINNIAVDVREGGREGSASGQRGKNSAVNYYKVENQAEDVSQIYMKSLEAIMSESTFEHLA